MSSSAWGMKKWDGIPAAIEIEKCAIGVLAFNGSGSTLTREAEHITSEHFTVQVYRETFEAMSAMDADGMAWEWMLLLERMKRAEKLPGESWQHMQLVFTDYNLPRAISFLEHYTAELEEARKARALMAAMESGLSTMKHQPFNTEQLFSVVRSDMDRAITGKGSQDSVTIASCKQVLDQIDRARKGKGKPLGIYTGVPCYDSVLGGMFPGLMDVIGARPKVGKTSLIETAIANFIEAERPVSIFQKDMSPSMMFARMACRQENIVFEDFIYGVLGKPDLYRVEQVIKSYMKREHLIRMHNPANFTVQALGAQVQKDKDRFGVQGFFLDQFQKLRTEYNRVDGLTEASIELREIIDRTQLVGIVVAQISKEADKAGKPHAGQFKYCDQLFSDADRIVLLWSEQDPKDLQPNQRQVVQFTVDANRMGAPSDNEMAFHRELMTWEAA